MITAKTFFGEDGGVVLGHPPFQLLLFANVVGVFGTALVSPLLSTLIEPFDATPSNIGLMISLFSGPGIVFIPIAGYLADRIGRKHIITVSLIIYGLAGGMIAFTTDFYMVLALRALQGIGYAGIVPIVITSLGDFYSGTEEAAAQGLRFTTSGLSLTVVPLLAGGLVLFGWQYPFLVFFAAVPVALLIWVSLEEPTASTPDDSRSGADDALGSNRNARMNQLYVLTSRPELVSIIVARSLAALALIGFFTYVSIIVVSFADGTPQQAGLAVAINSLAFATTASQVGRLSVRFRAIGQLVGGTAFLGIGLSLVALSDALWPILVGSAILGMGVGITLSIYRSLVTSYAPDEHRGSIVSLMEMAGRFANFLTPIAMGWAIGVTTPIIGFESAVRWIAVGAGVLAAVGGFGCLTVWYTHRDVDWNLTDSDI